MLYAYPLSEGECGTVWLACNSHVMVVCGRYSTLKEDPKDDKKQKEDKIVVRK